MSTSTNAYFCRVSGVRIVAPGVSKLVDPKNGHELAEPPPEPLAQRDLAADLERAREKIATMREAFEVEAAAARADREQAKTAYLVEFEKQRAAHGEEIGALRAAHAAELEQLTKPADADAPTAPDRAAATPPAPKKKNP